MKPYQAAFCKSCPIGLAAYATAVLYCILLLFNYLIIIA